MSDHNVTEAVLFGLIQQIGPKKFVSALNNVCSHGEVFKQNFEEFLDDNDKFLNCWFDGIQVLNKASKMQF